MVLKGVGERRKELLLLMQRDKAGLTVDVLAERLSITRTAVRQHLAALARDGYVSQQALRKTAGRPGHVYALTPAGDDLFPKQYSWFSAMMLNALRQQLGSRGLESFLRQLAASVASDLDARVKGRSDSEKVAELVKIMNELGYDSHTVSPPDAFAQIVATNCVYHHLAQAFPEVCHFDYELMEKLTGSRVRHPECMVRGGKVCSFLLEKVSERTNEHK
ncbi:MAG TPA: HTH domain-containing protein [Burkholderiales bacterium]|nr:HTH domain-containing protein [Burkholderiales bacterium]